MAWDSQSKQFNIVINIPNNMEEVQFHKNYTICLDSLSNIGYLYFTIYHDSDLNSDGVYKTKHYHLVLVGKKKRRCSTIAYMLQELIKIPLECIRIQLVESLPLAIQYLTHKNHKNKFQYDYELIRTNNADTLYEFYSVEVATIKVDELYLYSLVDQGYSECEILFKIGIGNYNMFHNVIKMLLKEKEYKWRWEKLSILKQDKDSTYE